MWENDGDPAAVDEQPPADPAHTSTSTSRGTLSLVGLAPNYQVSSLQRSVHARWALAGLLIRPGTAAVFLALLAPPRNTVVSGTVSPVILLLPLPRFPSTTHDPPIHHRNQRFVLPDRTLVVPRMGLCPCPGMKIGENKTWV